MKKPKQIVRSTKLSLKYSNLTKIDDLELFITEYKRVLQLTVDILWNEKRIPKMLDKKFTDQLKDTWLSQRMIQCIGKQGSAIVRGTIEKFNKRTYVYNKFLKEGCYRKARKLKTIIDKFPISKPDIKTVSPELDSRFIKVDMNNKTSFDIWITIASIGNHIKLQFPVKRTKHFNELYNNDKLSMKSGIRLSEKNITFNFKKEKCLKENGITIGTDIGINDLYYLSNGEKCQEDIHGHTFSSINEKLCRKKKGSVNFRKAQEHRKNHLGWSLNQIDLTNVKELKCEKLKNVGRGKTRSRQHSHFNYRDIFEKLERKCELEDVLLTRVSPTYTSQRCFCCGWVRKANRDGKQFKCKSCGYESDADLNASRNIALDLPAISRKERLKRLNVKGFYWQPFGVGNL